jgi:hypothetical protein
MLYQVSSVSFLLDEVSQSWLTVLKVCDSYTLPAKAAYAA